MQAWAWPPKRRVRKRNCKQITTQIHHRIPDDNCYGENTSGAGNGYIFRHQMSAVKATTSTSLFSHHHLVPYIDTQLELY